MKHYAIDPAVLSTKEAWAYCGGRPVFERLLQDFPTELRPFRRTPNGKTQYLRKSIDALLARVEFCQHFVD